MLDYFSGTTMNQTPFSFSHFPAFSAGAGNSGADLWSRIGALYQGSMQQATQELWTSSARIIQEHTTKAFVEASQSCMQALAENAAAVQQKAFAQLMVDHQKAGAMVSEEVTSSIAQAVTTTA